MLYCYLGMALHKLDRHADALESLEMAIAADARNPLAKFEKAAVLTSMEQYAAALAELGELQAELPREASVFFQVALRHHPILYTLPQNLRNSADFLYASDNPLMRLSPIDTLVPKDHPTIVRVLPLDVFKLWSEFSASISEFRISTMIPLNCTLSTRGGADGTSGPRLPGPASALLMFSTLTRIPELHTTIMEFFTLRSCPEVRKAYRNPESIL